MPQPSIPFGSVVFAGGGCRCLWQVGFWQTAAEPLGLTRDIAVAGVSAGAAMACMILANRVEPGIETFLRAARDNRKNFYFSRLFSRSPMFPQGEMYRRWVEETFDTSALERLHAGPEVHVSVGRMPRWLGPRLGTLVGLAAYRIEKLLRQPVHPTFGRSLGFFAEVFSSHRCHSGSELADLLLHSACTPPFTRLYRQNNRPVVDGGVVDNVPVEALPPTATAPTLVMLTRQYGRVPEVEGRTYVQPSEPVPITVWDYSHPERVQQTYDLGRRDGERFVEKYSASS